MWQNSLSPWEGSGRWTLTLISGYVPNPLDINRWTSLGLGVDPAAPRLCSRRSLESKGVHSEPCDSTGGLSPLLTTYQTPWNHLTRHSCLQIPAGSRALTASPSLPPKTDSSSPNSPDPTVHRKGVFFCFVLFCFFCMAKSAVSPLFRRPFACHCCPGTEKELKPQGWTASQNGVLEAARGVPGCAPRGLAPRRAPARLLSLVKHGPARDLRQLVGSTAGAHQAAGETSR